MTPSEPQELGDFRIEEKLGQGAMGTVYRAHQTSLHRVVALKVLPPHHALNPEFIARFKQEAMAAAALNHPHIVQVYAAGESGGTHFFAMEYVEGETLGSRVERKGRLDPREALAVTVYVARALDYAWRRAQIIHRDIKPDNIFLSREGEVKLGDLGLAKTLDAQASSVTQTGASMGTPYYVSPEQARGDKGVDFRADIYSLGCTLFHTLTGTTPYQGDSAMGVMLQHLTQPPPEITQVWPACPPPITGLLERMLRKDPGARHQSYEELLQDLMWVSEKLEEPGALAEPALSMIVPAPAAVKATAILVAAGSASLPPAAKGSRTVLALAAGAAALLVIGVLVWAPWKKPAGGTATVPPVPGAALEEKPSPPVNVVETPAKAEPVQEAAVAAPKSTSATDAAPASSGDTNVNSAPGPWIELFNGRDISQWRGSKQETFPDGVWAIETGALRNLHGPNDQHLVTRESYRDFELEFEWKISPGGNSGIFYGPREFQLVDDAGHKDGKVPNTSTGSLCYLIAPNALKQIKPAGEYNQGRLIVNGNHVEHWINGEKVVEYDFGSVALKTLIAQSQYKDSAGYADAGDGTIQLQTHAGNVWFRNVRIRRMSAPLAANSTAVAEPKELKEALLSSKWSWINTWQPKIPDKEMKFSDDGVAIIFVNGLATGETFLWTITGPRTLDVLVPAGAGKRFKMILNFDEALQKFDGASGNITVVGERLQQASSPASSTPGVPETEAGVVSLFNGRDLSGWDGDPQFWSVRDGVINAESPANGSVPRNTYLIWKGGNLADFELRLSFKITAGNSGVQYRSKIYDPATWSVVGYQYEMNATNRFTNGALFEEAARRKAMGEKSASPMLANVGEKVLMTRDDQRQVIGTLNGAFQFHAGDWNELTITAQGNHLTHQLNGVTTVELTDDDVRLRVESGVIALQLHGGSSQKVQFKGIRLKTSATQATVADTFSKTAVLARKVTAPFSGLLLGTIWTVRDSLGEDYFFEFAQNGALNYESKRGLRPNGKWRQDGSTVSIEINDGVAKFTGTLSGQQMRGNASSTTGGHWTWEAKPR